MLADPDRVVALLGRAAHLLAEAAVARDPGDRFVAAHLAALKAVGAVLAARGRPARARGAGRSLSAWVLLPLVAPELEGRSTSFAEAAVVRAAVESGRPGAVSAAAAERHRRLAGTFVGEVADLLGVAPPQRLSQVGW